MHLIVVCGYQNKFNDGFYKIAKEYRNLNDLVFKF